MILSKENLSHINAQGLVKPQEKIFNFPEKVLQFGTGVLLRGLPDYFIDKANSQGVFNGRVAVVKSTSGNTAEFDQQDSLYTLCVRGVENGSPVHQNIISSAISRVIAAEENWSEVLEIAKKEDLKIVVSNTTEVGIALIEESIDQNPPKSFPAKLLAVLYERYKAFNGNSANGLVIIATELIPDNGKRLGEIVLQLATFNKLEAGFLAWLETANTFCNSLVDRIVPGIPDAETLNDLQQELGYTDNLLSMAEPYRLWAIEGGKRVSDALTFAQVDAGVVIAEDIEIYRELKVRLLNGTHTLSSGIAFLAAIPTVTEAMDNELMTTYIGRLMAEEIAIAIPYQVTEKQTADFASTVKDRFANPSIAHLWANIAFQYSMKMKIRILPLLLNYYKKFEKTPQLIAFGFGAYLAYARIQKNIDGKFYGELNGQEYQIVDDSGAYLYEQYQKDSEHFASNVLGDKDFWNADLSALNGFIPAVEKAYEDILNNGIEKSLAELVDLKLKTA